MNLKMIVKAAGRFMPCGGNAHGHGFHSAINGRNRLGEHFSPVMAVFAPLHRFRPNALIILPAQAAAVALGVVLLDELALIPGEALPPPAGGFSAGAGTGSMILIAFVYRLITS